MPRVDKTTSRDDLADQILQQAETVVDLLANHVEGEFEVEMAKGLRAALGNSAGPLSLRESHVLSEVAKQESTNASSMAEKLRLTRGGLSKILSRLEKKGFLCIQLKEGSKKEHAFSLTDQGKTAVRIHDQLHREMEEKWKELLRTYDAGELRLIERVLRDVARVQQE